MKRSSLHIFRILFCLLLASTLVVCGKGLGPSFSSGGGGDDGTGGGGGGGGGGDDDDDDDDDGGGGGGAPTITNISPSSGGRGTTVTVTGTNLTGATVTAGGVNCHTVVVSSSTQLTCMTGAHASGSSDVVVTTSGGSATSTGGFTYKTFIYTANRDGNSISVFEMSHSDGSLTAVETEGMAPGYEPEELALDPFGKFLYIRSNDGTQVIAATINPATGALTANAAVVLGNGIHELAPAANGNFLYACDNSAAVTSAVLLSVNRSAGTLSSHGTAGTSVICNGSAASADGLHLYQLMSSTGLVVDAYTVSAGGGTLTTMSGSPFGDSSGMSPQAPVFSPAEGFLFVAVSSGVSDQASVFVRNPSTGQLTQSDTIGLASMNAVLFTAVHPTLRALYVNMSNLNQIATFNYDATTGELTSAGANMIYAAVGLNAIAVERGGRFLYMPSTSAGTIGRFSINQTTGLPTATGTVSVATGTTPTDVAID